MIRVEFVCSPAPRQIISLALTLPDGSTLRQAVDAAAATSPELGCLADTSWDAGVWGRRQPWSAVLRDGDRVEAYRPLQCDPKEARRLRYRQAGTPARTRKGLT